MAGVLCSMVGASFVTAAAEVIRRKKSIIATGNAQIDTAQSKFGGASALFDGTNDRLTVENISDMALGTGDFTIEFWMRQNSGTGNQVIYDHRPATNGAYPYIGVDAGQLHIYIDGAYRVNRSGTTAVSTGIWYHIAWVRNSGTSKLYRDGTEIGSFSDSFNYLAGNLNIGEYITNGFGYNGWLDEIRVSNTARYTAAFTSPTAPFVNDANTLLLLHMDGTDAVTFFEDDNGVRAQRGITAVGNAQVDTAQSQFGGSSALFDGTGDFLTVQNIAGGITADQTFEFWIRFANLPGSGAFRMVAGDGGGARYLGLLNDGGTYRWEVSFSDGQYVERFTTSVATNTWYHVALTKSGSTLKMYQAGSALTSAVSFNTMSSEKTLFVAGTNYIGSWNTDSNFLNGWMDEIRVSNSVRYTTTFTPSTTPFVNDANTLLLLHMDGTDASTVFRDDNGVREQRSIIAVGAAQIDTAQSKFGGASALFDGTSDYLQIPNAGFNWGTGDFTIEFWARHAAVNDLQVYFDFRAGGTDHIIFYIRSDNKLEYYDDGNYISTTTLAANTWYHLALSRSGSTLRLFINGTQEYSVSNSRNHVNSGTAWIGISVEQTAANSMNGHLDEFRVSNTARYTANFTPSTTPFQNDANTLLLLHMDGTDASTVFIDDNGTRPT